MRKYPVKSKTKVVFWGLILVGIGSSSVDIISKSASSQGEKLIASIEYLKPLVQHMKQKHKAELSKNVAELLDCKHDRVELCVFAKAFEDIADLIAESTPRIKQEDTKEGWQALFAALYALTSIKRASELLKFQDERTQAEVQAVAYKIDNFLDVLYEQLDGPKTRALNFDPAGLGIRQILLTNIIPALELSLNKLCTATSNIDVIETQVDDVDLQNQTLDSKVDVVDDELELIQSDVTTVVSKVCIIDSKVDVLDDEVSTVNSLVDALQITFGTIDSKLDVIDDEVITLDSKVDVLDDTADTIESKVCVIESKVDIMPMLTKTDTVDAIESKVCVTLSKLCDLDSTVADIESDLDQIMTDLSEIKSLVITLTNC